MLRGVFIAKRSTERVQDIPNRPGPTEFFYSDGVIQLERGAFRVVEKGSCVADGVLPIREVQVLPLGPDPVELSVV